MQTRLPAQQKSAPPPSFTPVRGGILQRKCGCGGSAGLAEECEGCSRQNLSLQRSTQNSERETRNSGGVPPIVNEVLSSPGQPLDQETRAFMEPRFGHDFSRVRVHVDEHVRGVVEVPGAQPAGRLFRQPAEGDTASSEETQPPASTETSEPAQDAQPTQAAPSDQPAPPAQPVPPAPPPAACSPTGFARADYLTQPGTSTDSLGLTTLSFNGAVPQVQTTPAGRGVRLQETTATLQTITSVYTEAGIFTEGEAIVGGDPASCRSGRYPIRWEISSDGAQKIREGEIEHCADFQLAFDLSLRRYADAVNGLARSRRTFRNQRAAEAELTRQVRVAPDSWFTVFSCLAEKTRRRDGTRGNRGWHSPHPRTTPPSLHNNCAFAKSDITGSSLPQVGQHPPSEIIKDCGEAGTPTGGSGRR